MIGTYNALIVGLRGKKRVRENLNIRADKYIIYSSLSAIIFFKKCLQPLFIKVGTGTSNLSV